MPKHCDELARKGTGVGACDAVLDKHGNCPRASEHVHLNGGL